MPTLFKVLIGCTPAGRHTEQHDIFFGIADSMKSLIPHAVEFWPEAKGRIHIDAWRAVTKVNGYEVKVIEEPGRSSEVQLFFINLGGYKENQFEEFHYKMVIAAAEKGEAVRLAKQTAFYKHTGFKGATSHIDDKYGIDVDDIYDIHDILPESMKARYSLDIRPAAESLPEDEIHLGYFKLDAVDKWGKT